MMTQGLFKPTKPMTFATADIHYQQLIDLFCTTKEGTLVICLSEVTQCDSAGLALLIEAKRLAKKYHKKLIIEGMTSVVQDMALFCGVEDILIN